MFSSKVDPPDDVLLTVRCCHDNGEYAADVMLFTLVIRGALQLAGLHVQGSQGPHIWEK